MKTIKVTDCGDCPLRVEYLGGMIRCVYTGHLLYNHEVPRWCPLVKESVKIELID